MANPKRKVSAKNQPPPVGERTWKTKGAAAAALGIPVAKLDAIRNQGCVAFRNGRIYECDLLPFLNAAGDSDKQAALTEWELKQEKLKEEVRRLKIDNDRNDKILVDSRGIIQSISEVGAKVRAILDRKLRVEYPKAVNGLTIPQAAKFGQVLADQIMSEFRALEDEWPE